MNVEVLRQTILFDIGNKPENLRWKKRKVLKAIRELFEMDVSFISKFSRTERIFDEVDTEDPILADTLVRGSGSPLDQSYCFRVSRGITPKLIADASKEISVADIEATTSIPVGAHISVPIIMSSGKTYGMLCAFSRSARKDISERDVAMLSLCADLLARDIEAQPPFEEHEAKATELLHDAVRNASFRFLLQPILQLSPRAIPGYELLTGFPSDIGLTEEVFRRAKYLDLITSLEELIFHQARVVLDRLPPNAFLSINLSTSSIEDMDFSIAFSIHERKRIVVEITEHERVENYDLLLDRIRQLRDLGFKVAIDDVGAGYSSLRHVMLIRPDYIKIDRSLVSGIESNVEKESIIKALLSFSQISQAKVIAEGVEKEAELVRITELGVDMAQGYLIGVPAPFEEVLKKNS